MTVPQVEALSQFWQAVPPAAMQLKRIALFLGLPEPRPVHASAQAPQDVLRQAAAAGLPVMEGRPDDPLLAFLDL